MNLMSNLKAESIINKNLNIEIISAKEGSSEVIMNVDKNIYNPFNIVHGGAIFALGDNAAGAAAFSHMAPYVTLSANINYLNPGKGKFLKAIAKTVNKTKNTCVIEVNIVNDEDTAIAIATYTMYKVSEDFQ